MPGPLTRPLPTALLGLVLVGVTAPALSACTYRITRPDGTTETISRQEYEELSRNAGKLSNAPSLGHNFGDRGEQARP